MATAEDIVRIASGEIGYKEGANNWNKYGAEYGLNNQPWCVIFVWWVFKEAGASDLFGAKTAKCTVLYNNHKSQEVPKSELKKGDIVFFDWKGGTETEHVGIVEKWQDGKLVTIEGNTGVTGDQSNGDGVHRKVRSLNVVSHNFRPAYGTEYCAIEMPILQYGSVGYEVKTVQRLLMSYGYSMSPYGADGEFGSLTKKRVIEFQKKRGLEQDGVVGLRTYSALLKG